MSKNSSELFTDIPEIINSSYNMPEPNSPIPIYEGEFILKYKEVETLIHGLIEFVWMPSQYVKFSGQSNSYYPHNDILDSAIEERNLFINKMKFGDCVITHITYGGSSGQTKIEGIMVKDSIYGDKSIPVEKIKFDIPNLRNFHGLIVKEKNKESIRCSKSRIILENDEYLIIIDKNINYTELIQALTKIGGHIILYSGELTRKKGNLVLNDSIDIFHCLMIFISFLSGNRCSPIFLQGIYNDEISWTDYTDYTSDPYKAVRSWPTQHSINGFNEMWKVFSELWKSENNKDFLKTVVHWYIEVNKAAGLIEGSIIMTQTALELIYNWLIIENKKILIGKDSEYITAANKIRLLLSQLNISNEIPTTLEDLYAFQKKNTDIIDGPDAFTRIRNAIVHSKEDKRKELTKIDLMVKRDVLELGISYLELSILYILGFQGKYTNRCSNAIYNKNKEIFVPWFIKK